MNSNRVEDLDNDTTSLVFVLDNSYKNNNRASLVVIIAYYDMLNNILNANNLIGLDF